jgi:hypothetical protein
MANDAERVALQSGRFVVDERTSSPRTLASGLTRGPREQADTARGECNDSTHEDRVEGETAGLPGAAAPPGEIFGSASHLARRSDVPTSFGAGPDVRQLAFGFGNPPPSTNPHCAGSVRGQISKTGRDDSSYDERLLQTHPQGLISVDEHGRDSYHEYGRHAQTAIAHVPPNPSYSTGYGGQNAAQFSNSSVCGPESYLSRNEQAQSLPEQAFDASLHGLQDRQQFPREERSRAHEPALLILCPKA